MPKIKADFSETKERSEFSPRHVDEGEYLFEVKSSKLGTSAAGNEQLIFTLVSPQIPGGVYPYYAPTSGKAAWKLRALLEATQQPIQGKKVVNFDTDRLNGKRFGAELVDDEYNGRLKSVVNNVFPESELSGGHETVEDETDEDNVTVEVDDDLDLDEL